MFTQAAENLAKSMSSERRLEEGMSSNMVKGEPPTSITSVNGVNKVSCIDPKDDTTPLDGFKLPSSLGSGLGDGQCVGAQVIVYLEFYSKLCKIWALTPFVMIKYH